MIRYRASFILRSFAFLTAISSLHAGQGINVPEYNVGETAGVEVVAAVSFVAIDPEKTEALTLKEAQRVPVVFVLDTNAAARAVAGLREAFATNRENFMARIESTFRRPTLAEQALTNQRFARLVSSYRSAHKAFPLSSNLACAWAKGEPDAEFIVPLEEKLQLAMARFIHPADAPADARFGFQVKLVRGDRDTVPSAAEVARTRAIARSNVIGVAKWRGDFKRQFSLEEKAAGQFLSGFIQPTCFPQMEMTRALREKQTAGLSSVDRYEPGDLIVRPGQVVTAGTRAALDEYRAKMALLRGPEVVEVATWTPWFWAGGVCAAVVAAGILLWLRLRRRTMALAMVPASLGNDTVAAVRSDPVIRARLLEHFTRLLGQSVVQLFAQRGELIETQHAAAAQTTDLERRLEKVQADMQESFAAYEQRIAELEQELAVAEEQSRDLIRAKIAIAKQELEAERARLRVDWN